MKISLKVPQFVSRITSVLETAGFEAYLVGGCVRDLLLGKDPKDWDVTTNAKPEEIQSLFDKTFYENEYGTVGVMSGDGESSMVEVTPYRLEEKYSDKRHPDSVRFTENLNDDLSRRDFTINAIAYEVSGETVIDIFGGREDLSSKIIRAVGDPRIRFDEDALRIIRAIRFAIELGFSIERVTYETLKEKGKLLEHVSRERIRDELIKIVMSKKPSVGFRLMEELGILPIVLQELVQMIGVSQNKAHIYDVWEHSLRALDHAAGDGQPLEVRFAAFLHDVGKPKTKRFDDAQKDNTFYGHDVVGARIVEKMLKDLQFRPKQVEKITKLVRHHMFFSDPDTITLSAVRRIITRVGKENVWDLVKVRISDRIGMGRPKAEPYRLRKFESMIEEALRDPISVSQLFVNGQSIMDILGIEPGPKIGFILHALLEEVLDDPQKNKLECLTNRIRELGALKEEDLKLLGEKGKGKKLEEEEKEVRKLREKYNVQ